MIISILLHLYQPPQQHAFVFSEIFKSCYLPLIKLIKSKKDFKVVLNTPLSFLEWLEKNTNEDYLKELKALRDLGRVEIVGSGAYHPILTKLSDSEIERQVILNESGLAYYLGRREGFEGEPSFMIKNIKGFFAPELAVSNRLGKLIGGLGYSWMLVDESSVSGALDKTVVGKLIESELNVVTRSRDLSLCLAYNRTSDAEGFLQGLWFKGIQGIKFVVLALDAESFGHHNKEGIDLLENVIDASYASGHRFSTISDVVENFKTKKEISLVEASWGASNADIQASNPYPKWYIEGNKYHSWFTKMEELALALVSSAKEKMVRPTAFEQEGNLPIWNFNKLSLSTELNDEEKNWIKARIMVDKALNSDKYWWSSRNPDLDLAMIKRSVELFARVYEKLSVFSDEALVSEIRKAKDEILELCRSEAV